MKESRVSQYRKFQYVIRYYNSDPTVTTDSRMHVLEFMSSCTEQKALADTAVRLAKEHHWSWSSFMVLDPSDNIVATRISRSARSRMHYISRSKGASC